MKTIEERAWDIQNIFFHLLFLFSVVVLDYKWKEAVMATNHRMKNTLQLIRSPSTAYYTEKEIAHEKNRFFLQRSCSKHCLVSYWFPISVLRNSNATQASVCVCVCEWRSQPFLTNYYPIISVFSSQSVQLESSRQLVHKWMRHGNNGYSYYRRCMMWRAFLNWLKSILYIATGIEPMWRYLIYSFESTV